MKVHAVTSRPQYERHVRAIWKHLPDHLRGTFLAGPQASGGNLPRGDVVMVGATIDFARVRQDIVFVEHGAGFPFAYQGGEHPERVRWYIAPRQDWADHWGRPAFAAGCPALDDLAATGPTGPPTVAITFHWDRYGGIPEYGTAAHHYLPKMAEIVAHLRACGFGVVGHWHPRAPTWRKVWRDLGVVPCGDIDTVLSSCHLLLADATSVMYEMAALDRPVLALNCPEYRRTVNLGIRFWDHIPGWQIDHPDELLALDVEAYWREDWSRKMRDEAVAYCYARRPGDCGRVAAAWLAAQLV